MKFLAYESLDYPVVTILANKGWFAVQAPIIGSLWPE
jgi:hypothetical protein